MSLKIDGKGVSGSFLEGALAENGLKSYFKSLYNVTGGLRIEFTVSGALKIKPFDVFQFASIESTPKVYQNKQFRITSIAYDFANNTSKVTGYQVGNVSVDVNNIPTDPPLKRRDNAVANLDAFIEEEELIALEGGIGDSLKKANNLSDLDSASDARDNLGLGNVSVLDLGSTVKNESGFLETDLKTLSAGNGLTGTDYNGSTARTLAIGTPSTLTVSSTNSTTATSHNHALDLSGRTLTIANDADSVLTFPSNAQNLGANRTWTPTIASHGEDQRGTLDPTAQSIYGDKTLLDNLLLSDDTKIESSEGFVSGFAGSGAQLIKDTTWKLELDDMFIRGSLFASEFIINQISALNGSDFLSVAVGKIEAISGSAPTEVLTMSDPQGNDITGFVADDIVIVQQVTPNAFDGGGTIVKRIVREVDSVTDNVVTLKALTGAPTDSGAIAVGDIMVALGNTSVSGRQAHIYRSVVDSGAPFVRINDGVSDWASFGDADKLKLQYGQLSGLTIDGVSLSGYGLYTANAYLTGNLLVGDLSETDNFLKFDGSLTINAGAFLFETNRLFIDSEAANNGLIALGNNASAITVANNNAGIALNGNGDVKFYGNADNFLRKVGTSFELRSTNTIIKGGDLEITGTSTPSIVIRDSGQDAVLINDSNTILQDFSFRPPIGIQAFTSSKSTRIGSTADSELTFTINLLDDWYYFLESMEVRQDQTAIASYWVRVEGNTSSGWKELTGLIPVHTEFGDQISADTWTKLDFSEVEFQASNIIDVRNNTGFFSNKEFTGFRIYVLGRDERTFPTWLEFDVRNTSAQRNYTSSVLNKRTISTVFANNAITRISNPFKPETYTDLTMKSEINGGAFIHKLVARMVVDGEVSVEKTLVSSDE